MWFSSQTDGCKVGVGLRLMKALKVCSELTLFQ
jgi:hypothetical protein